MLLQNKTNEQIASELKISIRTVQNYKRRLEQRYGDYQIQKTDNTLFLECQLFKNRMLTLYKGLEKVVTSLDRNVSGMERAKCAEMAANIAIDVLKMESEGIKVVKDALIAEKEAIRRSSSVINSSNSDSNMMNDELEENC